MELLQESRALVRNSRFFFAKSLLAAFVKADAHRDRFSDQVVLVCIAEDGSTLSQLISQNGLPMPFFKVGPKRLEIACIQAIDWRVTPLLSPLSVGSRPTLGQLT